MKVRKLLLKMDELRVESFVTAELPEERGTVDAAAPTRGNCNSRGPNNCPATQVTCGIEPVTIDPDCALAARAQEPTIDIACCL